MTMGRRKPCQESLFVCTSELSSGLGHPFYRQLNELLDEVGFDRWIESKCQQYYKQDDPRGRRSLPPGIYFRMLLIGYYEGIGSQRGIAWRCADSLSLRQFLGIPLTEPTPDHSTLTHTRKRLPTEVFDEVFEFVLSVAAERKLLSGTTVAVDSTTLEADAAMKSIIRRDTGEDWKAYVIRLMRAEGVIDAETTPSDEEVRRFDKSRPDKKVSNEEWVSTTDSEAKVTKMKDGTTHLAYKAEHVVDLDSDLVLAAEIYPANESDMSTGADSVMAAQAHLDAAADGIEIEEVVADKGYHSAESLDSFEKLDVKPYVPEPKRKVNKKPKRSGKATAQRPSVIGNRRRMCHTKGKGLQRLRSERCERTFAHLCDTGGMRRSYLRGVIDVAKRYMAAAAAHNLGRIMRKLFGVGKPKVLQAEGEAESLAQLLWALLGGNRVFAAQLGPA